VQGGLGAAPLLMTLVSRPVLGSVQCYSCSGHMSLSHSGNSTVASYCSGHTPDWWARPENFPQWSEQILPEEKTSLTGTTPPTLFSACFAPGPHTLAVANLTFLQVLQSTGAPSYFAAALLNIKAGLVPVLTEATLQVIWDEYANVGYYAPTAGTMWSDVELIQYFQSTNA
jgi:hypothetical protein